MSILSPKIEELAYQKTHEIIKNQVTPWIMGFSAGKLEIQYFNGDKIRYQGIAYAGSPEHIFWSGYIEPFLKDAIENLVSKIKTECVSDHLDYKKEFETLLFRLKNMIRNVYEEMKSVDQRMRGGGYPQRIKPKDISGKIFDMNFYAQSHINLEIKKLESVKFSNNHTQTLKTQEIEYANEVEMLCALLQDYGEKAFDKNLMTYPLYGNEIFQEFHDDNLNMAMIRLNIPEIIKQIIKAICDDFNDGKSISRPFPPSGNLYDLGFFIKKERINFTLAIGVNPLEEWQQIQGYFKTLSPSKYQIVLFTKNCGFNQIGNTFLMPLNRVLTIENNVLTLCKETFEERIFPTKQRKPVQDSRGAEVQYPVKNIKEFVEQLKKNHPNWESLSQRTTISTLQEMYAENPPEKLPLKAPSSKWFRDNWIALGFPKVRT